MVMRPEVGSHRRCSSDIAVDLPAPVCPTRATEVPGLASKLTSLSTVAAAVRVFEADVLEADLAARRPQGAGVVLFRHAAAGVQDGEEVFQRRQLEEQRRHERGGGFQAADQQHGDAHEADDLTHAGHAVHVQPGADDDDGNDGERAGGAGHDVDQRPPVQHRELVADHLLGDVAEQLALGRQAGEGLHHHDVGQRILRGAGERGVQPLDPALRHLGLLHHDHGEDQEDRDQRDQHQREAPVQEQRQRQQDGGRQDGGKLVAEEHQPGREQPVGAGQHLLDQAAGVGVAVERQRQGQHVLEVLAHGIDTMPVRQSLGLQRDDDVADDAADADGDPDAEQHGGLMPQLAVRHFVGPDSRFTTRPNSTGSRNCRPATIKLAKARKPAIRMSRPSRPRTRPYILKNRICVRPCERPGCLSTSAGTGRCAAGVA